MGVQIKPIEEDKLSRIPIRMELLDRFAWFINLRWLAILGVLFITFITHYFLKITTINYLQINICAALLFVLNLIYYILFCEYFCPGSEMRFYRFKGFLFAEIQIVIDLILLTFLLQILVFLDFDRYFLSFWTA